MAKTIWCKIFGCDFRYNFASIPDKCICKRCKTKYRWDYNPYNEWKMVNKFETTFDLGTDKEMADRWVKRV